MNNVAPNPARTSEEVRRALLAEMRATYRALQAGIELRRQDAIGAREQLAARERELIAQRDRAAATGDRDTYMELTRQLAEAHDAWAANERAIEDTDPDAEV